MSDKQQDRGILIAAIIVFSVFFWRIAEIRAENSSAYIEPENPPTQTVEEFRTEFVDPNPIEWIKDEIHGQYALEKLLEGAEKYTVSATVYNALVEQCNGNPLITADGSRIDKAALNRGEIKWIAISRDLKKYFKYGEVVYITGGYGDGFYEIHDTMHSKWSKKIDFLVPDSVRAGYWKNNVIIHKIQQD